MRHRAANESDYTVVSTRTITLTATERYRYTGWVNIPETADTFTFRQEALWYNTNGKLISITPLTTHTTDTNGAWQQVTADVQPPAGTRSARIRMVVQDLSATIYVDDLAFRP
jgi:hypothetical protein